MMTDFRIRTKRLDLVQATIPLLASERDDTEAFTRLLDTVVPGSWPPPLVDAETLGVFIRMISEKTDPFFFSWYWIRDDPSAGGRVLIGCGGIASSTASPDTVCIGYSVLEEYQNQGYATGYGMYRVLGPGGVPEPGLCHRGGTVSHPRDILPSRDPADYSDDLPVPGCIDPCSRKERFHVCRREQQLRGNRRRDGRISAKETR